MKRIYLDTTVVNIRLFGELKEQEKYSAVIALFAHLNSRRIEGLISLYTLQEIYTFCEDNFPPTETREIVKLSFQELLKDEVEIAPMLKRTERLLHRRKFFISDPSDQPHAILAYLNNCQAIVTYDDHFDEIRTLINVYTPEELLEELKKESIKTSNQSR